MGWDLHTVLYRASEVLLLQRYVFKLALMGSTHVVIVGPVHLHTLFQGDWGHVDHCFRSDISLSLFYRTELFVFKSLLLRSTHVVIVGPAHLAVVGPWCHVKQHTILIIERCNISISINLYDMIPLSLVWNSLVFQTHYYWMGKIFALEIIVRRQDHKKNYKLLIIIVQTQCFMLISMVIYDIPQFQTPTNVQMYVVRYGPRVRVNR